MDTFFPFEVWVRATLKRRNAQFGAFGAFGAGEKTRCSSLGQLCALV